jgi:MoaA/NifB/PqqE/SkfB family radical SAM enzyme
MTPYLFDSIEWEITSACNAACPQCPRNYYGSYTWPNLPIVQIDLDWVKKYLPESVWLSMRRIDFCGTYGDPIMNNNLISIIEWIKTVNPKVKIEIKTNGGIRDNHWWKKLASVLSDKDHVVFGIDGLEDTNHLYRRGVNYEKVIENAKSFISAGGKAYWSFIVFKHNQHQVDEARLLSKELGFQDIIVKKTWRFFNKNHEYQDRYAVLSKDEKVEYYLEMPSNSDYINEGYQTIKFLDKKYNNFKNYLQTTEINCHEKAAKQIYISAEGLVFPCGWIHDRMYGYEAEQHSDHDKLYDIIDRAGGMKMLNLNYTNLNSIVSGEFFRLFQDSWTNNSRLERCSLICGTELNGIKSQNQHNSTLESK